MPNQPLAVSYKVAANLMALNWIEIFISGSNWIYDGGG